MPKVPSGADVVKALVACGFEKVSQKGSHVKLKNADGRVAIVPIASIARQAGVGIDRLRE